MPSPVKVELTLPEHAQGSTPFTVSVTITNLGNVDLLGVEVEPSLWIGRLITEEAEVRDIEESELEARRRSIIKEMEVQVERAYERQAVRKLSTTEKIAFVVTSMIDGYMNLFSRKSSSTLLPSWTTQAFRIHDWTDVENLEKEIISLEDPESKLRKAFSLDKEKLSRCLEALSKISSQPDEFETGVSLPVGSSVTFPFSGKAPHLFRRRSSHIQFKLNYRETDSKKVNSESISQQIAVSPSAFAIPTGGMIGAACGYAIRKSLETGGVILNSENGWQLFGCTLLGLVVSLLVSRKPDTYKAITAEDFLGGFLIGSLSGLFGETILEKLRLLVSTKGQA